MHRPFWEDRREASSLGGLIKGTTTEWGDLVLMGFEHEVVQVTYRSPPLICGREEHTAETAEIWDGLDERQMGLSLRLR